MEDTTMRRAFLFVLLLSVASAKTKPDKIYPEHGTVISMRTERATHGSGVYTDPYGKTHGGRVRSSRIRVYKVRTTDMDYELDGRRRLAIGDEVTFRIEKGRLYVQLGDKEQRFTIVGQEKR